MDMKINKNFVKHVNKSQTVGTTCTLIVAFTLFAGENGDISRETSPVRRPH